MDEIYNDARFAHIPRDPAFKRIPKSERKVKIDKRFESMFHDKRFKVKYTVDKRGRPISNTSTENLRKYYALESSSGSEEASDDSEASDSIDDDAKDDLDSFEKNERKGIVKKKKIKEDSKKVKDDFDEDGEVSGDSSQSISNEDIEAEVQKDDSSMVEHNHQFSSVEEKIRSRLQDMTVDYARGEGVLLSDSSSDEESPDEEEDDDFNHGWGELNQGAGETEDSTHRLAICNMDWDRVRAADLMVLLSSFLPQGGAILSVTIYPSEYGLQRMKEEDEKGPIELVGKEDEVLKDTDLDEEETVKKSGKKKREEGDRYHIEKLRQYQLNRLKYYYAVVVCDSIDTADALYKECDGREYESSAARLDLRFIPDDTTFDQEPREKCTELPDFAKYEPDLFVTTALTQSKVELTWDETDPRRRKINEKLSAGKVDDVDENDLKVYLASSSDERESDQEGEDKEETLSKYRSLLQSVESVEKEKNMNMEVTWGIGLQQKVDKRLKEGKPEELTPFEKYVQKCKERRKAKREEQLKKKQQFRENANEAPKESGSDDDDVPSDVDMNDPYFKEEFQKEEFAHLQKNSSKKKKNSKKNVKEEEEDEDTKRKKAELELLLMDEEDNRKHFSLKDILVEDSNNKKKKRKKKQVEEEGTAEKQDDFEINVKDNRFSALFTSHLYNIDPADPHYKKTKGMEALREEKLKRRGVTDEVPVKKQKLEVPTPKDSELSLLVKNVKRKTKTLNK